jgi:hypothetical protein
VFVQVPSLLKIDVSNQIVLAEVDFLASQYVEMPALLEGLREPQQACCANGCAGP